VDVSVFQSPTFKEFVVKFDNTGKTVKAINEGLLKRGIFGGKDISMEFPEMRQSAIYCVTEIHRKIDIDKLADALREVVSDA